MIAAANSFTDPWGGPEFGRRVFFTTDVALRGCRNDQAGNSSRQLLSPAGRKKPLLSESLGEAAATREAQFQHRRGYFQRLGRPVSVSLWNLVGVWGLSGVSQPVEGALAVSLEPPSWNECKGVGCGGGGG
uniref:Uncharacterized protein n=1 Tax=Rousettus aegyptiacus TaxID=9407 RepID=A0A7J8DHT1_ROUAE|nr:hypothetical protein HJG63_008515 [Rousettus aegyptiacus]